MTQTAKCQLGLWMEQDLYDRMIAQVDRRGISRARWLREAVEFYLEAEEKNNEIEMSDGPLDRA